NSFARIETAYKNLEHRKQASMDLSPDTDEWLQKIDSYKALFEEAMDDDFNTAKAISVLFDLTREANMYLQRDQTSSKVLTAFQDQLVTLFAVLGIKLVPDAELLDAEIESLIDERNQARDERNFARADEIRDLLKDKNIILEDTPQGTRWRR